MPDNKRLVYPPKRFVGLHAHCGTGSPYDGLGYPNQHIDFVLSNEMNAWALTDHGNGNGLAHAHTYAKKLKKSNFTSFLLCLIGEHLMKHTVKKSGQQGLKRRQRNLLILTPKTRFPAGLSLRMKMRLRMTSRKMTGKGVII